MSATSPQRRELVAAVVAERSRCARLVNNAIRAVNVEDLVVRRALEGLLDRIRRPLRVRAAAAPRRRPSYCCGNCGGDGHTIPRCPNFIDPPGACQ